MAAAAANSAAARAVREHAINQLTSDLDQERTEEGARTQTWRTGEEGNLFSFNRGHWSTCRTQKNHRRLHLYRIYPVADHQSLASASIVLSLYSYRLLRWCRNATKEPQPAVVLTLL